MSRFPFVLAALADSAVPGLRPAWIEEVAERVGEHFRVVFVEDEAGRSWVVRVPTDAVAAAQQDEAVELLGLLGPRLPFAVPRPAGFVPLKDGRRAMIYPLIPGRTIRFSTLPAGPGLADTFGRALAAVHDVDRRLFEEADVPTYDAQECRARRQVDVDRGAQTGLVPTGLLNRWERMLDDVSWWRFAPTPIHGHLDETHVLCEFDDESDAASGRIAGMTSWEGAQVGDPAEDLAALVGLAAPDTIDTVLAAYAGARHEPPDAHLLDRAYLLRELRVLSELLTARNLGDRTHVVQATEALRRLDDEVSDLATTGNRGGTAVDRLPVDYDPEPTDEHWYRAGRASEADDEAPPATDLAVDTGTGDGDELTVDAAEVTVDTADDAPRATRDAHASVGGATAPTREAPRGRPEGDLDATQVIAVPARDEPTAVLPAVSPAGTPPAPRLRQAAAPSPAARGTQPAPPAHGDAPEARPPAAPDDATAAEDEAAPSQRRDAVRGRRDVTEVDLFDED